MPPHTHKMSSIVKKRERGKRGEEREKSIERREKREQIEMAKKKMKMRKKKKNQEKQEASASFSSQMVTCPNCPLKFEPDDLSPHMRAGCEQSMPPGRVCLANRDASGEILAYVCGESECVLNMVSFHTQAQLSAHKLSKHEFRIKRSSDWADLPKHLLDSVLKRLPSTSDYMHFSIVCTSWNSVAKDNLVSKRIAPMLLTYSGKEEIWNLCDITRDKVLDLQLELPNKRYVGFSKGWLITMDENFIVTLIDPFSRVKGRRAELNSIISLPVLFHEETRTPTDLCQESYIFKAMISADPIANANDCIVFVIYGKSGEMAFIRLQDTSWTYIYAGIENVHDVVYVEDKFFAVHSLNQLWSIAVTPRFNPREDLTIAGHCFVQQNFMKRYLVDLSDRKEVLMVQRYLTSRGRPRETTKFEVFKLVQKKWTKLNSLGGASLFLGDNSSISLLASEVLGCLSDCIYFLQDHDLDIRPCDFGLYNIKTESFIPVDGTQAATLIMMSKRTPIWVDMPKIKL